MSRALDIVGKRFGRLVVIRKVDRKSTHSYWLCKCDCGREKIVRGHSLICGDSNSCGCRSGRNPTHGHYGERIYRIWDDMKARCYNPKSISYPYYGGKGVAICEAWREFQPFYEWAMQNGYSDKLTIDRIDVNQGYSPDNCRWVDMLTQQNNKSSNRYITYHGETLSLSMWSRKLNVSYNMLLSRLKRGWSFEKAIETPSQKRKVG